MRRIWLFPAFLGILLIFGAPAPLQQAQAQTGDCSQVARSVMNAVQTVCSGLKRDRICYGNVSIEASPAAGVSDFEFTQQGDVANLQDVETLKLKTLDINNSEWGVALMKVKASLPDDSSENITILLFGNVEVENKGADLVNLPMVTNIPANVRLRPAATGPIAGSLSSGSEVIANGRMLNAAGEQWIRVQFPAAPGGMGWVLGAALTTENDVKTLIEVKGTTDNLYGPMQAFTFKSGEDDSPCDQAPESGITIQTPKGKGQISLLINEVNIQIGSTAFIQAVPGGQMRINTLEGHVITRSMGETRLLPPGTSLTVPLNEDGNASGPPSDPEPYDRIQMALLNVVLDTDMLDRQINAPDPMDEAYLEDFNEYFNQDDSEFFDGDGNDYLFEDFFSLYFDDELSGSTENSSSQPEEQNFGTDISNALVEYWTSSEVPSEYLDEFAQATFSSLDPESQQAFLDTLSEQSDSTDLNELEQIYEDYTSGDDSFDENSGESSSYESQFIDGAGENSDAEDVVLYNSDGSGPDDSGNSGYTAPEEPTDP